MFVIPSYYDGSISNVHDTIQSIQKFHPGEKIVVCDADSPNKTYTENYKDTNVIFFDAKNKRRPVGALLETYKEFPDEDNYVLIHDTADLLSNISNFFNNGSLMTAFVQCPRPLETLAEGYHERYFVWMEELMKDTDYEFNSDIRTDNSYSFCVGSMAIYSQEILKRFFEKGLYENFNKRMNCITGQFSERCTGYLARLEGVDLSVYSMEGNSDLVWQKIPTGELKYFRKTFGGR